MTPSLPPHVRAAFDAMDADDRAKLMRLRGLILEVAASTSGVGAIEETLKWGQPSYLTSETKSGTTIRLGITKSGDFGLFTHCQTTVVSDFRDLFEDQFRFDGNRGFLMDGSEPEEFVKAFIKSALTYHLPQNQPS